VKRKDCIHCSPMKTKTHMRTKMPTYSFGQ